ncbi:MAG: hypothetical protein H6550_15995 [Chitinophagales bacterium]|nr:hypothetical protein [Chitinophagales bacterium]
MGRWKALKRNEFRAALRSALQQVQVARPHADDVLVTIEAILMQEMLETGQCVIPDLCKLTLREKPPRTYMRMGVLRHQPSYYYISLKLFPKAKPQFITDDPIE